MTVLFSTKNGAFIKQIAPDWSIRN